jgi:urease accessory protein
MLDLLQLADSGFPTGAYAHSLGLEGLYAMGDVDLVGHCRFVLANGLARLELPIVRLAYSEEVELDELMDALLPVRELREASRSMVRSFRRVAVGLGIGVAGEHHAVVYGAVVREWGIPLEDGLRAYSFGALRQQLQAAQRLGRIGQSAVQANLNTLKPDMEAAVAASMRVDREDIGGFAPLVDVAAMRHTHAGARLFLS